MSPDEFADPRCWDVVKTDGTGRPIGLSRVIGCHVISLFHDVVARRWWWSVLVLAGDGPRDIAHGSSPSAKAALHGAYAACVVHGALDANGTMCRPHEADAR